MEGRDARDERRAARASWPVRRVSLADENAPTIDARSVDERIAMVWQVTLDAWASSGQPWPDYERASAPGRIVRSGRGTT